MRLSVADYLDGKRLDIDLTIVLWGVPVKVSGSVEVFDVRVPAPERVS